MIASLYTFREIFYSKKPDQNYRYLCYNYCASTSFLYIYWDKVNVQNSMLYNNEYNNISVEKYYQEYCRHLC